MVPTIILSTSSPAAYCRVSGHLKSLVRLKPNLTTARMPPKFGQIMRSCVSKSYTSQIDGTSIRELQRVNSQIVRSNMSLSTTHKCNSVKIEILEPRHYEGLGLQSRYMIDLRSASGEYQKKFVQYRIHFFSSKADGDTNERAEAQKDSNSLGGAASSEGTREGTKQEQESGDNEENTSKSSSSSSSASASFDVDTFLYRMRSGWDTFQQELGKTWDDLLKSNQPRGVNKRIHDPIGKEGSSSSSDGGNIDNEAADKYDGVTAITVIKEDMSAWEKMQRRLTEAPIIQGILGASSEAFKRVGGDKAKQRLEDLKADASEAWETSQNPWVYRLSSVYDTLTAESEFALAVKELRRLDPEFTSLEQFKNDVMETMIPELMSFIMEGQTKQLKPLMGEAVYNRLAAEIRVRKSEGLVVDPHILGMENSEILAAELDENQRGSPIILLHYMCQQINCVRKKDTGEIVEGGEDEIRANSYIVALQREYDDQEGALNWKVVDFRFNGGIPWI